MVNIQLFILIFRILHANQPVTSQIGLKKKKKKNQLQLCFPAWCSQNYRCETVLHKGYLKIFPAKFFFPLESWEGKNPVPWALAKYRNRTCLTRERCSERLVRHAKCMIISVRKGEMNAGFPSFSDWGNSSVSVLILPANERRAHKWSNTKQRKHGWCIKNKYSFFPYKCIW